MDKFTRDDLTQLADQSGDCLCSLYMPTERSGSKVQKNRIHFRNVIDQAEAALENASGTVEAVQKQIEELRNLESDDAWWQHQSEGLAIFLDGNTVKRWRLPHSFEPRCVCSDKFHVRPLCRLLQNDGRFYLLAASLNKLRLFLGTKWSISEVEDADLPDDLRSALNIDEYVSSLQHHSTAPDGGAAMFHGHGGSDPDVKKQDEIKQYFHHIDSALKSFLGGERVPLVFAGVQYLFPIFQETCGYDGLIDDSVTGNPDDLSGQELHEKAWPVVEKQFETQRGGILERFGTALSQQLGSDDLDTILAAAQQGQIETLLTVEGEGSWTEGDGSREDRVNSAVVDTLRHKGDVYTVQPDQLDQPAAAILRYPISAAPQG